MFDDTSAFDYWTQYYYDEGYGYDECLKLAAKAVREEDERHFEKQHGGWSSAAWDYVNDAYARGYDPFESDPY